MASPDKAARAFPLVGRLVSALRKGVAAMIWQCPTCGAAVIDTDVHRAWHEVGR